MVSQRIRRPGYVVVGRLLACMAVGLVKLVGPLDLMRSGTTVVLSTVEFLIVEFISACVILLNSVSNFIKLASTFMPCFCLFVTG